MGSFQAERTTTGLAGRVVSWIWSPITYTLWFLVKIPDGMAPDLCAEGTVYSPLNHFVLMGIGLIGVILVLGGVGLMGMKIAKALGQYVTVISSSDKKKVEALEHLGVDEYLVISDSEGMQKAADSLDYITETVPVFHPLEPYLSLLKLSGKFVTPMVMLERKSITGNFIGSVNETDEVLQFFREKDLTSMIEVVKMDDVNTAMERPEKSDVPYRVSQEGKVVSIGRKMMDKRRGFFSSFILYFDKRRTHELAQEASITKPVTKKNENKGWFKVFLMLFLLCTTGPSGVRSEDIGNPLIPGSTAMDFLLANKNLRGPSVRRQMRGTEAAAVNDNFNYPSFPHRNSPPNSPARNQANPYKRSCNPGDKCRQGKKGKKN